MRVRGGLVALWILASLPATLSAQTAADPASPLYADLSLWQARGLLTNLPPLRPYSIQLLRSLLEAVVAQGDQADTARATRYLDELGDTLKIRAQAGPALRSDVGNVYQEYRVGAVAEGLLNPWFGISGQLGAIANNGGVDSLLPRWTRSGTDASVDASVVPVGGDLTPRVSSAGGVSLGTASLYFEGGVQHVSFGPFWNDNVVLGPTAPEAGAFAVVFRGGNYSLTSLLLDISAVNSDGSGVPAPNKFLALHALDMSPVPWLKLGLFESVVWGGRFEPVYLLPVPNILFYAQGLFGYRDNSFLGGSVSVSFPGSIGADVLLYVDDAAFNDLIRLRFNTMLVLAGQARVTWTPHLQWLEQVKLDYLLITPYAYSHRSAGLNYLDYTNAGENMGPPLQPDSDQLELRALARPLPWLDVSLLARNVRHGNGSEGVTGGNGTIFDDGYTSVGIPTFTPGAGYTLPAGINSYTRFMTQHVIENTFQLGMELSARLETGAGSFSARLGYTLELVKNVDLTARQEVNNYFSFSLDWQV